jgi:predicted small secreted protein
MKTLVALLVVVTVTGCGTVGGAVSGAGADMQKAGEWIKKQ